MEGLGPVVEERDVDADGAEAVCLGVDVGEVGAGSDVVEDEGVEGGDGG